MNSSKFRLTLDLHSVQSQHTIPVMIGDTSVTLLISITDGGIPYVISDGCLAKLSIKRPTGTYIEEFCKIKNNAIIEYPFSQNENTCAVRGIHFCDVTIYGPDGGQLGGPRFTMSVNENVVEGKDVIYTDENQTAVNQIIKEEAARKIAEEGRVKAEKARAEAEVKREKATGKAIERAEEAAKKAEDAANNAGGSGGSGGGAGKDGTTFIPDVSPEGVISWTNDGGRDNPEPVNIKGGDGKNAYEYAQDGGFAGTETEFSAKLAKKIPEKTSELANDSEYIKASGAPVQTVNNKTGNVTLDASDVGARPDTWMPNASEVGARPATWTPTASEVGARPDTWTPTYSDVGADKSGTASSAVSSHNSNTSAHADIRELISQLSSKKVDKTALTLGLHSDNKYYIFVNGTPVGTGFEFSSGDVFGYVDENNVIVLNGALADGTYTIKYEMENGNTINIGNMVLDTNVYYSVTKNLTQCSISNSATQVVEGESYSATISANSGYTISSITVTMGGVDITSTAVSGGNINIASVTGDIVITAVAEEVKEPTNFFVVGGDGYLNPGRASSTGADRTDVTDCFLTNYIEVQNGDEIYAYNAHSSNAKVGNMGLYKADKSGVGFYVRTTASDPYLDNVSLSDEVDIFTIAYEGATYMRVCCLIPTDLSIIKINIKRNGEWL